MDDRELLRRRIDVTLAQVRRERLRQEEKFPDQHLPNGTGPAVWWSVGSPSQRASVLAERARQRTDAHAGTRLLTWRDVLLEEVAEAFAEEEPHKLAAELIQVAAVAARWAQDVLLELFGEHDEDAGDA
jgi:hypothetical protein